MHIPQGPTAALALELFDDALAAALRPSPDYDVSRWLYVPNHYSEYRYILGTLGPEAPDLHGYQPLHRRAGRSGPHPPVRPADRAFQRVRQLLMFNVYAQGPPGPTIWSGPATRCSMRRTEGPSGISSLCPRPPPCGPPGEHHREARVSDGLYAGLCRRRQRRRGGWFTAGPC